MTKMLHLLKINSMITYAAGIYVKKIHLIFHIFRSVVEFVQSLSEK